MINDDDAAILRYLFTELLDFEENVLHSIDERAICSLCRFILRVIIP